jgi:3-hydroxyisobutyrate dehydrogenase-like beta-hydroxyacid dehydrogenase
MGAALATNLVAAGFPVRVWNRSRARAEALKGVTVADTPREAAQGADFVITMLADDAAVEAVTGGVNGLLEGLASEAVHIGMSTVSLAATRRLAELHAAKGRCYVAGPVFGRPEAARAGQLWIVAGGDPVVVGRCEPVLKALGQGLFVLGSATEAILTKLAGNFMIGATVEALGEALALGEKGGLDPDQLLGVLTGTLFGSPVVRNYGARIARTDFEPAGFAMPLGLKDFRLILAAAAETGVPMPLAELVRERLENALRRGRDHYDWAGLASVIREAAGLPALRELP